MAVYVVTWNLNNEGGSYSAKRDALYGLFEAFSRYKQNDLDSVIFLSAEVSIVKLRQYLLSALDANDTLFISKLNRDEYEGWLSRGAWQWIIERV